MLWFPDKCEVCFIYKILIYITYYIVNQIPTSLSIHVYYLSDNLNKMCFSDKSAGHLLILNSVFLLAWTMDVLCNQTVWCPGRAWRALYQINTQ